MRLHHNLRESTVLVCADVGRCITHGWLYLTFRASAVYGRQCRDLVQSIPSCQQCSLHLKYFWVNQLT